MLLYETCTSRTTRWKYRFFSNTEVYKRFLNDQFALKHILLIGPLYSAFFFLRTYDSVSRTTKNKKKGPMTMYDDDDVDDGADGQLLAENL